MAWRACDEVHLALPFPADDKQPAVAARAALAALRIIHGAEAL